MFYIYTYDYVKRIRTLLFDGGFCIKEDAHRKISFRISEIGKPRVVLRLYVVKGVVSPSTLVMAGYKTLSLILL